MATVSGKLTLTGNLTKDAWEIERTFVKSLPNAPVKLPFYLSTALPKPVDWVGSMVWCSDLKEPAFSDGDVWKTISGVTL